MCQVFGLWVYDTDTSQSSVQCSVSDHKLPSRVHEVATISDTDTEVETLLLSLPPLKALVSFVQLLGCEGFAFLTSNFWVFVLWLQCKKIGCGLRDSSPICPDTQQLFKLWYVHIFKKQTYFYYHQYTHKYFKNTYFIYLFGSNCWIAYAISNPAITLCNSYCCFGVF